MILKGVIFEDTINYKKTSMTLMFPNCSFKCGTDICQNNGLIKEPSVEISAEDIVERYLHNPLTHAIVMQGLEPFDSFNDVKEILDVLRDKHQCHDDIVIYTGFDEQEIAEQIDFIKRQYDNIIIKFGRYIPNQKTHYDEIIGVYLASDNQYAKKIS